MESFVSSQQNARAAGAAVPVRERRKREWELCAVEEIPLGQGRAFVVGGEEVAVFRQRDGQIFALQARCPHRGGPLADGLVGNGLVLCPLHGWAIELATGACREQRTVLRTYSVRVHNGRIFLTVPEQEAPR